MPDRRASKGKARPRAVHADRERLTSDELTGLRNRFETWQRSIAELRHATLVEFMLHESYAAAARSVADAHGLPDRYTVDLETGRIVPPGEDDEQEVASGG